jgi:hypothetical protein
MWQTPEERLALLELLVRGVLKRRHAQAAPHDTLAELPWTRATGRRNELRVAETRRDELVALLARVWPGWGEALAELTARGLPPTHDGTVRLRPPRGLVASTRRGVVELGVVADVLGEVAVPERAFRDGLELEGALRAVLLVENLGAWCDFPEVSGWLYAYVPGWDTATVVRLLDRVRRVPVVHFGDLDPSGVRIHQHLRERRRDLLWFVPSFWDELVESKGQRGPWPDDLDLRDAPPLVRELARRGLWLEQEPIVVDPRITAALEEML